MDTSRLPSYRSSYLLRFHPYPRVKLSARERILLANAESYQDVVAGEDDGLFFVAAEHHEPATVLHKAIFPDSEDYTPLCRQRRPSLSTIVVDLALMVTKRAST
ncbi:hypothetical protein BDN67DRAFT_1010395 [Paxillus ammoniavirescens]|nr:hypothetical protein BDN67DRAFT_1010395 [Paxillus ammoniavirescens]